MVSRACWMTDREPGVGQLDNSVDDCHPRPLGGDPSGGMSQGILRVELLRESNRASPRVTQQSGGIWVFQKKNTKKKQMDAQR